MVFEQGSTHPEYAGSAPVIELIPELGYTDLTQQAGDIGKPVERVQLNATLESLLGKQSGEDGPVPSVGIIFTTQDAYKYLFGLMFDQGEFGAHLPAREGAAVYLDEIHNFRSTEIEEQILFTTVHELGHVFHLQHNDVSASFMRRSHKTGTYPARYFKFTRRQNDQLRKCDTDPEVWPGGSPWRYS